MTTVSGNKYPKTFGTTLKNYIRSLISPGDSIGVKSAMAVTGPLS